MVGDSRQISSDNQFLMSEVCRCFGNLNLVFARQRTKNIAKLCLMAFVGYRLWNKGNGLVEGFALVCIDLTVSYALNP